MRFGGGLLGAPADLTPGATTRSRPILAAALIGVLLGPLDIGLVGVALPSLTASFEEDVRAAQAVIVVYLSVLGLAYIPAGRLGDRYSHPAVFRAGALLFALGAVTAALAPALLTLLVGRLFQGLGAAGMAAAGQALAFAAGGERRSGRNLGLVHAAVAIGMLAGPIVGGLVLERAQWPVLFLVEPPLAIGAALALRGKVIAAYVGAASTWLVLRRREVTFGLALAILTFVAMSANMFVVPYFLQRALDLPPAGAGALMGIVPMAILFASVPAGVLADRYASRWPAAGGLGLVTMGVGLLAAAAAATSVPTAVGALVVYGLGAALFQAPNNRAILRAAPRGAVGLASGLLGASRQAGQVLGVLISGALLRAGGALDEPGTYLLTFVALAGVAAGTAVIAIFRGAAA